MRPGDVMPTWGDGHGFGVVLATSRHKRTDFPEAEARAILLAYEATGEPKIHVWFSHTQQYMDAYGCHEGCEVGTWCEDGNGKAWVRVLVAAAPFSDSGR